MYQLPDYTESDRTIVLDFMRKHPFITLIVNEGTRASATQVPVLIEEIEGRLVLRGHVMRKTDHYLAMEENPDALVLFHGANCYVSSSWYTEKQGATWNYQTVHARGKIKLMDKEATIQLLTDLTKTYEASQERPLFAENLPGNYINRLVSAIAGFEIEVSELHPIFKLSQNRDDESYMNIVSHLEQDEDPNAKIIAAEMKKRRLGLF